MAYDDQRMFEILHRIPSRRLDAEKSCSSANSKMGELAITVFPRTLFQNGYSKGMIANAT